MKANFLSSVSHELRSPLVAMEKSISLILSKNTGPINETQEQFLTIAERNIKRLSRLINDILDLTKLEAGKLELKPQPSSIESIIKDSVDGLNTWAQAKSIALDKKIEEGIPLINADPDRLVQVLTNLIANAIKFTPNNGNITVEAVLHKDKQEVEVSVKDTGIGIEKEKLDKVFDKFYQVGERSSADVNGTGIGLSIAREIVELHGGKIWAESEKGYGTKFIFTLPAKVA
jgi:signal transduction histidine kinase